MFALHLSASLLLLLFPTEIHCACADNIKAAMKIGDYITAVGSKYTGLGSDLDSKSGIGTEATNFTEELSKRIIDLYVELTDITPKRLKVSQD